MNTRYGIGLFVLTLVFLGEMEPTSSMAKPTCMTERTKSTITSIKKSDSKSAEQTTLLSENTRWAACEHCYMCTAAVHVYLVPWFNNAIKSTSSNIHVLIVRTAVYEIDYDTSHIM